MALSRWPGTVCRNGHVLYPAGRLSAAPGWSGSGAGHPDALAVRALAPAYMDCLIYPLRDPLLLPMPTAAPTEEPFADLRSRA